MKHTVFEIPFLNGTKEDTFREIVELKNKNAPSSVLFVNAHVVVEASHDAKIKTILNQATMVVPDGVPITWVMKLRGQREVQRYSGPDLMADIINRIPGARHFFLGSTPETLKCIENRMTEKIAFYYSPPFSNSGFTDEEQSKHLKLIEDFNADFIWIGLGAPKQERYAVEMAKKSKKGVWLAVGAAFDFYAGVKPRAPLLMQKAGLEWAFRFVTEPRRLAKRYLLTNPVFVKLAIAEVLKK